MVNFWSEKCHVQLPGYVLKQGAYSPNPSLFLKFGYWFYSHSLNNHLDCVEDGWERGTRTPMVVELTSSQTSSSWGMDANWSFLLAIIYFKCFGIYLQINLNIYLINFSRLKSALCYYTFQKTHPKGIKWLGPTFGGVHPKDLYL